MTSQVSGGRVQDLRIEILYVTESNISFFVKKKTSDGAIRLSDSHFNDFQDREYRAIALHTDELRFFLTQPRRAINVNFPPVTAEESQQV
jgi:hypothetical protein